MVDWKPIETAPKDRPILGYLADPSDEDDFRVYVCKWSDWDKGWVEAGGEECWVMDLTHWAELPEGPK